MITKQIRGEKKWNAQIYLEKERDQFLPEYILKTELNLKIG